MITAAARNLGTVAIVVAATASCASNSPTDRPIVTTSSPLTRTAQIAPPAPPPTPTTTAPISLPRVTAPAPMPYPSREILADPITVSRAWMAQWCAMDYREPRNWNVQRASAFQTSAAAEADLAEGETPDEFQQAKDQRRSRWCDAISAIPDASRRASKSEAAVLVTAVRTEVTVSGTQEVTPLTSARRVLRDGPGRWLVDVAVAG